MTVVGSSLDFAIYYKDRRMGSQNVAVDFPERVAPKIEDDIMQQSIESRSTIEYTPTLFDQPTNDDQLSPGEESSSEYGH